MRTVRSLSLARFFVLGTLFLVPAQTMAAEAAPGSAELLVREIVETGSAQPGADRVQGPTARGSLQDPVQEPKDQAGEQAVQAASSAARPEQAQTPTGQQKEGASLAEVIVESDRAKKFSPSVALVRRLANETELPAMQLSLGLVNFVGDVEPELPGEDAYAILPLRHDAVLEVYDLHYDGQELIRSGTPRLVREMGANEAFVFRVPYFGGVPTKAICVSSNERRYCWHPGDRALRNGFLYWSKTKGME